MNNNDINIETLEGIVDETVGINTPTVTVIPNNPASIKQDLSIARFYSSEWLETIKSKSITVGGCGGIGSWVVFMLSRLKNYNLTCYDPDIVTETNLGGQLFGEHNIGRSKVYSLRDTCNIYSGYSPYFYSDIYSSNNRSDIRIGCFDNMEARIEMFNGFKHSVESSSDSILIDGRLSCEEFQVFCFRRKDILLMEDYEKNWLFPSSEAVTPICSYKQTTYMAAMIASVIVNLVINSVCPNRSLPYKTFYNAESFNFNITE